jgi:hypothetical protein
MLPLSSISLSRLLLLSTLCAAAPLMAKPAAKAAAPVEQQGLVTQVFDAATVRFTPSGGAPLTVRVRDIDPPEARLIASAGITLVGPGSNLAMRLASALQGRPAYVHFDCDVLEPGLVPTEYRVPGGLGWQDVREAFAVLAVNGIVGLEIAEFEDSFDPGGPPASAEALLDSLSTAWATTRP